MQRRWLEMEDSWTLKPKDLDEKSKHLYECKDNNSPTGHSLLVKFAATHTAFVNKNFRFYRPDKVLSAIHTWTNPIAAPVLVEHNKKGDVMGRVRSAKYIDETHKFDQDYPIIRDTAFYNTSSDRIPLHDSVDWIVENLGSQDDYSGLGYIELGTQITDPKAITKVFNDEYLNVSVGFKTDSAICSICHTDWAAEDKCKHRLGQKVNGKDTFLITGNLEYTEVSFVNFPADPFATRLSIEQFSDSLNKKFYLGLSHKEQEALFDAAGLTMTDNIISYEDDITVTYEDSMDLNDFKLDSLDNFLTEIKSADLTATKAFEYKNAIDSLTPETADEKSKVRSFKSTLNARIRKEKWVLAEDTEALTAAEMETAFTGSVNTTSAIENVWADFVYANDNEKAYFEDSEGLVTEINLVDSTKNYAITDSTEESAFCGPNKSFAVTDAASASACKAVLAKAPISAETKAKIEKAIFGREKELNILAEDSLDNNTEFTDAKTGVPEKVIGCYSDLHNHFTAADWDTRGKIRNLHEAVSYHWGATNAKERAETSLINSGHNVNAYGDAIVALDNFYEAAGTEEKPKIYTSLKDSLAKWDNSNVLIPAIELADKEEAINELTADLAAEKTRSASFFKESKRALASQLVMGRIISGADGFKDLTSADLEAKITEFAARNIVSLRDSVKDLLTDKKFLSGQDSTENATRVDETTQVLDTDISLTDNVTVENPQEGHFPLVSAFKYLSPSERVRYLAEHRWSTAR